MVVASQLRIPAQKPSKKELVVVGGGALPELTDVMVKISGLKCGGPSLYGAFYEISVIPRNGESPWCVLRRYRQFRSLLGEGVVSSQAFPPKLWTKMAHREGSVSMLERRSALGMWLQSALDVLSGQNPEARNALSKFLLLGRCGLAPGHEAFQESMLPSAPAEVHLLEVKIPTGLGPDDLMQVKVPGDEVITITIPWGLVPDKPLRLWWNPAENSLAVHHCQNWQALRK